MGIVGAGARDAVVLGTGGGDAAPALNIGAGIVYTSKCRKVSDNTPGSE